MVTIKDGCGCDPCDCDWKQKLKVAYSRAIQSVNKIGDNDGSIYYPDGTGFVKLPLPRQSDVSQIQTNTEDIADLKVRNTQLQADITDEVTAREEAIAAEASARETAITAEASAREAAITAEATAREEAITAEASAREAKDTELDADIARIDNTDAGQDRKIQDNADRITSTYNDLVSTEATVATHNTEIINLQSQTEALSKSLVSDVLMADGTTAGSVQVSIEREDGALITSANYRWGKDIGIRLEAGTQEGYVKAVISLSDGTELVSNEYKIVEVLESDVYVTAITLIADQTTGTLGGNISYSNGTTQTINSVSVPTAPGVTSAIETLQGRMTAVEQKNANQDASITAIDGRVQALENTPGIGQFGAGKLGTIAGSTTDGRVKAEDDGTGSVNGWSALKSRMTTAEGQIVTAQNDISALDGTVSQQTTDISGLKTDVTNLKNKNTQQDQSIAANASAIAANTSAIAGKVAISQGVANAGKALIVGSNGNVTPGEISGGEIWEEIDLSNFPTDWVDGDRVKFTTNAGVNDVTSGSFSSGNISISGWRTDGESQTVEITIGSTVKICRGVIRLNPFDSGIVTLTLLTINTASNWNSSTLFTLRGSCFNGYNIATSDLNITRSNLSTYVVKMWRLKQ